MKEFKKGLYEHYKGKSYRVHDIAYHSETEEKMVIYEALYECDFPKHTLWVRPLSMFQETVSVDGKAVPRFRFIR